MAINQNHLFEELGGIKCSIVEKNASPARVGFLRRILEYNRYTVIVVPSPPPKVAVAPAVAAAPVVTPAPVSAPAAIATPAPFAAPAPVSPATPVAPAAVAAPAPSGTPASVQESPLPAAPTTDVAAQSIAPAPAPITEAPVPPPPPETFTVGVTDTMFNPINAIFGRLLKAPGGHVVTLAFWQQKENESNDQIPYFNTRN